MSSRLPALSNVYSAIFNLTKIVIHDIRSLPGDRSNFGGKAVALGKLADICDVPPGFVISTEAFTTSISVSDEVLSVDPDMSTEDLSAQSDRLQGIVLDSSIDSELCDAVRERVDRLSSDLFAVRSSATGEDGRNDAWAGQLETFLNVSAEDVLSSVKRCWASVYSPRALAYQAEKGLEAQRVAVIVQAMVQSDVAGTAFSAHPVTGDTDMMVIEAGFGLGEAVVSGEITPDTYIVDKESGSVMSENISEQEEALRLSGSGNEWNKVYDGGRRTLSAGLIDELVTAVLEIEEYFDHPVDVEWCLRDESLFIVQSRPITTV